MRPGRRGSAGDEIARLHGTLGNFLAAGVGLADDVTALETAAGDTAEKTLPQ
jgi:hypothetical protein